MKSMIKCAGKLNKGTYHVNEKNLSTVELPPRKNARIPRENGDQIWPRCIESPPRRGTQARRRVCRTINFNPLRRVFLSSLII